MVVSSVLVPFTVLTWQLVWFSPAWCIQGRATLKSSCYLYPKTGLQNAPIWSHLPAHFMFQTTVRALQQPAGLFLHAELVTKLIEGHLGGWCYAEFDAATLKHMPPSPSCCTFFQFVPFFSLAAFQKPYTAAPCS